jgi:hypothetical protein
LDDILDGHNVDDDLATEIKEDAKPSTGKLGNAIP